MPYLSQSSGPDCRGVASLRAGFDSAQFIARFETERQTLALMDHPHIARVSDGGITDDGQPYFVMELVRGTAITLYAQDHSLDLRPCLELFIQVCQAVQHAHQKGMIHRDLKPSNVLIAEYDGQPVPKIIDFGIAKAVAGRAEAQTKAGKNVFDDGFIDTLSGNAGRDLFFARLNIPISNTLTDRVIGGVTDESLFSL